MTRQHVLDQYFLEARHKLIELAAFLDRTDRAQGEDDFRIAAFRRAVGILSQPGPDKARQVLLAFSDLTAEPIPAAASKSACGAWRGGRELRGVGVES